MRKSSVLLAPLNRRFASGLRILSLAGRVGGSRLLKLGLRAKHRAPGTLVHARLQRDYTKWLEILNGRSQL